MKVGIVGCGQLARMLALAGWPMGLSFNFLAEAKEDDACVQGLGKVVRRSGESAEALYREMGCPEVITVEKEQVDASLLRELQAFCSVYPDPEVIAVCQHRGREKAFLNSAGIATAPYRLAGSGAEVERAVQALGLPVFIKSCEQGYDGQNQWRIDDASELDMFLAKHEALPECVVEGQVQFAREVSIIVVRGADGKIAVYPPTENYHRNGVLLTSLAPVRDLSEAMLAQADDIVAKLLNGWGSLRHSCPDYVGVLAIECFVTDQGLLVNELAPRVHNSGHWTQQGAATSQFENHLRAICGLPLGATDSSRYSGMINLLGRFAPMSVVVQANTQLHLYNKSLKPRRKLGHINLQNDSDEALRQQMRGMLEGIYGDAQ